MYIYLHIFSIHKFLHMRVFGLYIYKGCVGGVDNIVLLLLASMLSLKTDREGKQGIIITRACVFSPFEHVLCAYASPEGVRICVLPAPPRGVAESQVLTGFGYSTSDILLDAIACRKPSNVTGRYYTALSSAKHRSSLFTGSSRLASHWIAISWCLFCILYA